jgi:hypothetical protein
VTACEATFDYGPLYGVAKALFPHPEITGKKQAAMFLKDHGMLHTSATSRKNK